MATDVYGSPDDGLELERIAVRAAAMAGASSRIDRRANIAVYRSVRTVSQISVSTRAPNSSSPLVQSPHRRWRELQQTAAWKTP